MLFYTQTFRKNRHINASLSDIEGEFFVLTKDTWDDYNYQTTFYLDYFKDRIFHEIGLVRILHYNEKSTRHFIKDSFNKLTSNYISLGFNSTYYDNIVDVLGIKKAKEILIRLRDISIIGLEGNKKFTIEHEGIENSFFRSSDGRYLYQNVNTKYFLDKETQDRDYYFEFKAQLGPEKDFTTFDFDFTKHKELPNRMITIVGKNGVGKTRILNQLSEALFDSSKPENKNRFTMLQKNKEDLDSHIPIYNKIIAISFSVFDKFYKGTKKDNQNSSINNQESREFESLTKYNNYTYIGLHKKDESVYSANEIIDINLRAYKKITENNLNDLFIESINSSNILSYRLKSDFDYTSFFTNTFSSGQSIFITMLCRLLSEIEEGSLIFLDEPELYLHPNAIANLARIYNNIFTRFKSYAILCTHSPILLQEIPSRYVRKMSSIEGQIVFNEPNIETFGSNISDITADIFNVLNNESLYRTLLIEWSKDKSEEELLKLFDDRLSFKTQLFISSLYNEDSDIK